MHLLGFKDIFTTDTTLTRVRAVPRFSFSIQTLEGLNSTCPSIGIMPSGLPWLKRTFGGDDKLCGSLLTARYKPKKNLQAVHKFHDYMYSAQYSAHSCFEEIGDFIKIVQPKSMKGIVVSSSCYVEPLYYYGLICGTSQPPEWLPLRADNGEGSKLFRAVRIKSCSAIDETRAVERRRKWTWESRSGFKRNKARAHGQVKSAKISEIDCSVD